jgi:methyl-accepting chemotaxis protein
MQDIDEKSQRIANVIKVIDDIAFQTNILALNAAVEAARAGQHGKGFAVVSDEVRNLASKSAGAAKETAALIESSLHSVADGNTIVTKVSDSLQSVGAISDKNAASIEHLYEGSTQQSTSMAEINTAITQLSSVVQANSATAEETAASSEEMSAQSAVLNEIVSRFKLHRDAPETAASSQYAGGYAAPAESRPEDVISFADSNDKY